MKDSIARTEIKKSMSAGIKKHKTMNMTQRTNYQRVVRGHNKYTNYHSYRKMGGKNWKNFKAKK